MQLEAWNGLSSGLADCQRMIKGVNSISHPTLHRKDAPFIKVNNISAPDSLETVHVDRYQGPYRVFFSSYPTDASIVVRNQTGGATT